MHNVGPWIAGDLVYKPPHHGSHVLWHQDNLWQQCFPANMLTAWLALDDVNEDNGAMEMIPGSHLRANLEVLDTPEQVSKLDTSRARPIYLPAGGVTLHHWQTLHRSSPNMSARLRRAVIMRFIPVGTQSPRMNTEAWSFFSHPILRLQS
jgi:ectoine hydroxylase-related dioxygenase (phytanoyl-CoA dioxygenase family)